MATMTSTVICYVAEYSTNRERRQRVPKARSIFAEGASTEGASRERRRRDRCR